jgi:membrane-associated phospholipid phosphatase
MLRRVLPSGVLDVLRQIALCGAVYEAYSLVRGLVWNQDGVVFANGRAIISIEQTLHIFVEPSVQSWSDHTHWLILAADWIYLNAQFSVAMVALAYIYFRHNRSFYFVRNMFFVAMGIALLVYVVFPTAPPRLMPEWGFVDTVQQHTGITPDSPPVGFAFNPYAAVPSMHIAFALMLGWPLARLLPWRFARVACWVYPLLIMWVIVVTGNHFILDGVAGALVAAAATWSARRLARLRPDAWAFHAVPSRPLRAQPAENFGSAQPAEAPA